MRPDRIPVGEPVAPSGAPEPPEWLDDYGKEDFRRMCEAAARLGLLATTDGGGLAIHAVAYSRWRRAGEELKAALTVEGSHGGLSCHPAVKIQESAERTMLAVEANYGLSPSDRSRLRATDQVAVDPFDEYMRGRAK